METNWSSSHRVERVLHAPQLYLFLQDSEAHPPLSMYQSVVLTLIPASKRQRQENGSDSLAIQSSKIHEL